MKTTNKWLNKTRNDTSVAYWLNEYRNHLLDDSVPEYAVDDKLAKVTQVMLLTGQSDILNIRGPEGIIAKRLIEKVPANLHKKKCFKGLNLTSAISLNETLREPTLAIATSQGKIQEASSFFKFLMRMEATDINPFFGIKIQRKKSGRSIKRHPLTSSQLQIVFELDWFASGSPKKTFHYWVPLLLRYTGARLNEICQLLGVDVFERDGIWFITIRATVEGQVIKTANSERIIPISDELIRLGFIDFAKSTDGSLFPELPLIRGRKSPNATKWFSYWRQKLGFGRGYDLHSLRHNFINELKSAGIAEEITAEVVGHKHHAFTYSTYGHQYPTEAIVRCINKIDTSFTQNVTPYRN
ncbi:site-specific integrase [Vibrio astriarenae]